MSLTRYHRCASCGLLMPYLQTRCDCGADLTGDEEQYKVRPACGSVVNSSSIRCDCGYFFVFRSLFDAQLPEAVIIAEKNAAYQEGVEDERVKNDAEWQDFLDKVRLVNPYTKQAILSRSELKEYLKQFDKEKAELERRNARLRETRYLMETDDGTLVWVPEYKVEAWQKADHEAPLNRAERQVLDCTLKRTLKTSGDCDAK